MTGTLDMALICTWHGVCCKLNRRPLHQSWDTATGHRSHDEITLVSGSNGVPSPVRQETLLHKAISHHAVPSKLGSAHTRTHWPITKPPNLPHLCSIFSRCRRHTSSSTLYSSQLWLLLLLKLTPNAIPFTLDSSCQPSRVSGVLLNRSQNDVADAIREASTVVRSSFP